MLPTGKFNFHVTAWFAMPSTLALNWFVCDCPSVTPPGVMETLTGSLSVTVAVAIFEISATLVAVTRTVAGVRTVAGAVYTPLAEMLPKIGLSVHFTALFVLPVIDALKVCDCACARLIALPSIEMVTGGISET